MKKTSLRLLALLAVVFCCLPMLFTSLADDTAKEAGEIDLEKAYEELYVSDVDGDGNSDLVFFYDAYGKTSSNAVGSSITDHLGNTLSVSGATYGTNCLDLAGKKLNLTSFYNTSDDIYLDILLAQNGDRPGKSGSIKMGPAGTIQIQMNNEYNEDGTRKKNNSPIDESYGVLSGTYWNGGGNNWGTDIDWGKTHFLGAYIGEIYSIGIAVDKSIAAGTSTYVMSYVRDGEIVKGPSTVCAYDANTDIELSFGNKFDVSYYAVRLYSKVLSTADIAANRFADLMNYHRPDNFADYVALSDAGKARVQEACANMVIGAEDTEAAIVKAITNAYEDEMGGSFLSFDGYSMRMVGAREMRVTYSLDKAAFASLPSNTKILEIGMLHTPIGAKQNNESMKKQELTLSYVSSNTHAKKTVFATDIDALKDSYSVIIDCGNTVDGYSTDYMVRGYVLLEKNGSSVIYYENAESERFGATVSLARLSAALYGTHNQIPDLAPERVLENVIERAEAVVDAYEKKIADAENARNDADEKVASAKERANALKEEMKAIALAGVGADAARQTALKAEATALLAQFASIEADANTAHPSLTSAIKAIRTESDMLASLTPLALETLGKDKTFGERMVALFEAAVAEEGMQGAGFSNTSKRAKADVTVALDVAEKIGARIAKGNFGEAKTLKVLAIGNSFSQNAMSQLYQIASDLGYEDILLGNMYIGGCSIATHAQNARENLGAYSYEKNATGTKKSYKNSTLLDGILDEEWQVITVQQVSNLAPVKDSLTDGDFDYLLQYVKTHKNADAKIYYHATWAYGEGCNFNSYKKDFTDTADMDQKIASAVSDVVKTKADIAGVIYAGVAVKAAREALGADHRLYTDDSKHLGVRGCYVIGLTWFGTLTGEDISACADVLSSFTATEHASAIAAAKAGIAAAK